MLLRGINVGGHRKLLMKDLKQLLEKLGFINPQTYIQSGNVVFQYQDKANLQDLELLVADSIQAAYGFEMPIIIRSASQLLSIVNGNPFIATQAIENLHCTFFKEEPTDDELKIFNQASFGSDLCFLTKNVGYIKCQLKYSQSKLTNGFLEKRIGVTCTTRNWKTTLKLLDIARAFE